MTELNSGQLRIGDEWNAINILARSQTHPLKAVCELTENAIDAGGRDVHLVRLRRQGDTFLEITDDGRGIARDADGHPNFDFIATHICDSMKRHLSSQERTGIHGEFGIGLLSFWSLGNTLRMQSASADGQIHEMLLTRGDPAYVVRPVRGELPTSGTRIIVGPLLDATRNVLTGDKLQRYLASELRDRIRNTGAVVRVSDRITRRSVLVQPREFEGESLALPRTIATPHGEMIVELYLRLDGQSTESGVALCKDGTRVLPSVTELMQFQDAPWNDERLEGVIDYPLLNLAPGTRDGVVPDEYLDAFIVAMQDLEPLVSAAVESRQRAEREQASQKILKKVHQVFVSALRSLPENDYYFFDVPEKPRRQRRTPIDPADGTEREPIISPSAEARVVEDISGDAPMLPLIAHQLAAISVSPAVVRRRVGDECVLTAKGRDCNGLEVQNDDDCVEFHWKVIDGNVRIEASDDRCVVTGRMPCRATIEVAASQSDTTITAIANVKFVDADEDLLNDSRKKLPTYRLEPDHSCTARSRYDATANEIVINSAHRDFQASSGSSARHRRYIGKLYAKEVVLMNFHHESPTTVIERFIEVLVRTEDAL